MTKSKVYKGVACLEIASPDGGKWWYQVGKLVYTPILIKEIKALRTGRLEGTGREVLTTAMQVGGKEHIVVINLPRTDIVELKARGMWPHDLEAPHEITSYTKLPEYTGGNEKVISLA